MRNCRLLLIVILLSGSVLCAQSFNKGSLLVSASEGTTYTHYSTADNASSPGLSDNYNLCGDRDPLIVEYGISKKWGIGLLMGGDVFHINPSSYYGVNSTDNKVTTSELTVNGNYHFYNTKKWDLAAGLGIGAACVHFNATYGDAVNATYNAGGNIIRLSGQARYYVFKRIGLLGILSTYAESCTVPNNNFDAHSRTTITGVAYEFGFCYRILR